MACRQGGKLISTAEEERISVDRERANASQSASGLPELLAQLQSLAQQQGSLNGQMQSLLQMAQQQARQGQNGETKQQASTDIQSQGFAVGVSYQAVTDPKKDGIVLSQSPAGGTKASPGSTVSIVVGKTGPGPSPKPSADLRR